MSGGIGARSLAVAAFLTLGLLLLTLVYNTAQNTVPPLPTPQLTFLQVDRNATAERMSKALRFKTVSLDTFIENHPESAEAFVGMREFIKKEFRLVHENLHLEIINNYTLLYRWDGIDLSLKPYLLMSHLDVVPVLNESQWTYPPFEGRIENGYIWGRGALDDKMGVLQILEAIEIHLKEGFKPKRSVYLSFGHDEEVSGHKGNEVVSNILAKRNLEFEFVLDEGGSFISNSYPGISKPIAYITLGEKGYTAIELEVHSSGGHSSVPPSEGSISILSKAISSIQQNPMPTRMDTPISYMLRTLSPHTDFLSHVVTSNLWIFESTILKMMEKKPFTNAFIRTTIFPTIVEAGIKDNVIPDKARAVLNCRILPGDTVDGVLAHIIKVVNDPRVQIRARRSSCTEPSEISSPHNDAFKVLSRTVGQLYPESIVTTTVTMAATDGRWFQKISPKAVYRFSPMELNISDLSRIHGVDERISVENHIRSISFYYYLILNCESL